MSTETEVMEYRVTTKPPNVQFRALSSFFEGLPAKEATEKKEAKPARPAESKIIVVALGNAISQCGVIVNKVTEGGVAKVTKVETSYPKIPSGKVELQVAQLRVTMEKA